MFIVFIRLGQPIRYCDGTVPLSELAGGWCASLFFLIGDLDYLNGRLGLESPGSLHPCILCRADGGLHALYPWTVFCLAAAAWVATIWTYHAWISANPHRNALLRLPGISCLNVCPDWQHCKHLGCDAYFYGSVLAYFTDYLMQWDPDTNCDELFVKLRQQYGVLSTKHQLPALRMEINNAEPFPNLKATSAATLRCVEDALSILQELKGTELGPPVVYHHATIPLPTAFNQTSVNLTLPGTTLQFS